jgi:preprotein translocase subunit SecE
MRRRWRNLLTALGLTRVGRIVFTSVALLGLAAALADALIPRPQPESDIGPNAGGAVIAFTIGFLALIAAGDAIIRLARSR